MSDLYREFQVDFGKVARDYAEYRAEYPPGLYERLRKYYGLLQEPCKVLDLGAGTGAISRALAALGHDVTAVDISPETLEECKRLESLSVAEAVAAAQEGNMTIPVPLRRPITYCPSRRAEDTGITESSSFDLVFAGSAWAWFDGPSALREVTRLLAPKPTSHLVIAYLRFVPTAGGIVDRTFKLTEKYNPKWYDKMTEVRSGDGMCPQQMMNEMYSAQYHGFEMFAFEEDIVYTHEAWCGRLRACSGIGAAGLSKAQVSEFEKELLVLLENYDDPLHIPHRCAALVCKPPAKTHSESTN